MKLKRSILKLFIYMGVIVGGAAILYAALAPYYTLQRAPRIYVAIGPNFFTKVAKGTMANTSFSGWKYVNSDNPPCIYSNSFCWKGYYAGTSGSLLKLFQDMLDNMAFIYNQQAHAVPWPCNDQTYEDSGCGDEIDTAKSNPQVYPVGNGVKSIVQCGGDVFSYSRTAGVYGMVGGYRSMGHCPDGSIKYGHFGKVINTRCNYNGDDPSHRFFNGTTLLTITTRSYVGSGLSNSGLGSRFFASLHGYPWLRHFSTRLLFLKSKTNGFTEGGCLYVHAVGKNFNGYVQVSDLSIFLNTYFSFMNDYFSNNNSGFVFPGYDLLTYFYHVPLTCKYYGGKTLGKDSKSVFIGLGQRGKSNDDVRSEPKKLLPILTIGREYTINGKYYRVPRGFFDLLDDGEYQPFHSDIMNKYMALSAANDFNYYTTDNYICPEYVNNYQYTPKIHTSKGGAGINCSYLPDHISNYKFCVYELVLPNGDYKIPGVNSRSVDHYYFYTNQTCFNKNDCSLNLKFDTKYYYLIKGYYEHTSKKPKVIYEAKHSLLYKSIIDTDLWNLYYMPQTFLGLVRYVEKYGGGNTGYKVKRRGTYFAYPDNLPLFGKIYYIKKGSNKLFVKDISNLAFHYPGFSPHKDQDVATKLAPFYVFHAINSNSRYSFTRRWNIGSFAQYSYGYNSDPNGYGPIGGSVHGSNWTTATIRQQYRYSYYDAWNEGIKHQYFGSNAYNSPYFLLKDAVPLLNPYSVLVLKLSVKVGGRVNIKIHSTAVNIKEGFDLASLIPSFFPSFEIPIDLLALISGDPQPTEGITEEEIKNDTVYEAKKNLPCLQDSDGDGYPDCYLPPDNADARKTNYGTVIIQNNNKGFKAPVKYDLGLFPISSNLYRSESNTGIGKPLYLDLRFLADVRENELAASIKNCTKLLPPEHNYLSEDNKIFGGQVLSANLENSIFDNGSDFYLVFSKALIEHLAYQALKGGFFCKDINVKNYNKLKKQLTVKNIRTIFPYLYNVNGKDTLRIEVSLTADSDPKVGIFNSGYSPVITGWEFPQEYMKYAKIYITFITKASVYINETNTLLIAYKVKNHIIFATRKNNQNSLSVYLFYYPQIVGTYKNETISQVGELGQMVQFILKNYMIEGALNLPFNPFRIYSNDLSYSLGFVPIKIVHSSYSTPSCTNDCNVMKVLFTFNSLLDINDFMNLAGITKNGLMAPPDQRDKPSRLRDFYIDNRFFNYKLAVENFSSFVTTSSPLFIIEANENMGISYSLNGGAWSAPAATHFIRLRGLPDGDYTLKLMAVNLKDGTHSKPQSYKFTVDTTPPHLNLSRKGDYLIINASDNITPKNDLVIRVLVDNNGKPVYPENMIPIEELFGHKNHLIKVTVYDEAGNKTFQEMVWKASSEKSFGCSNGGSPVDWIFIFIPLIILGLFRKSRKILVIFVLIIAIFAIGDSPLVADQNPVKVAGDDLPPMIKNAFGIFMSNGETDNYLYGFIEEKVKEVLMDPKFENYLNVLLRRRLTNGLKHNATVNGIGFTVMANPFTMKFDFFIPYSPGTGYLYTLSHWEVKPLFSIAIPYGPGVATLNLYPRIDNFGGYVGSNNYFKITGNYYNMNPMGNFIFLSNNSDDYSVIVRPVDGNGNISNLPTKNGYFKIELAVKNVLLKLISLPPYEIESNDYNGDGIDDFDENADYLNRYVKAKVDVKFDLNFSVLAKVYFSANPEELPLGALKIYFKNINVEVNNLSVSMGNNIELKLPDNYYNPQWVKSHWSYSYPIYGGLFYNNYAAPMKYTERWYYYPGKISGQPVRNYFAGKIRVKFDYRCKSGIIMPPNRSVCKTLQGGGINPTPVKCNTDSDCSSNVLCSKYPHCVNNECVECAQNSDCRGGELCVNNVCVSAASYSCVGCFMKFGKNEGLEITPTHGVINSFTVENKILTSLIGSPGSFANANKPEAVTSGSYHIDGRYCYFLPNDNIRGYLAANDRPPYQTDVMVFDRSSVPTIRLLKTLYQDINYKITGKIKVKITDLISSDVKKLEGGRIVVNFNDLAKVLKFNKEADTYNATEPSQDSWIQIYPYVSNSASDFNNDSYLNDFESYSIATTFGNVIPASSRINMEWLKYSSQNTLEVVTPILKSQAYYGYVDGYKSSNGKDDPLFFGTGNNDSIWLPYKSGSDCSSYIICSDIKKVTCPPYIQGSNNCVSQNSYPIQFGLAINQDFLTQLIYEATLTGLLTFESKDDEVNCSDESVNSFFCTSGWEKLFPDLYKEYPNGKLVFTIYPVLKDPTEDGSPAQTPHVVVGVPNGETFLDPSGNVFWPAFVIVIPNLIVRMDVLPSGSSKVKRHVLDFVVNSQLGIDLGFKSSTDSSKNYPIGCGGNSSIPCELKGVKTESQVTIYLALKNSLKEIIPYENGTINNGDQLQWAISNIISIVLNSYLGLKATLNLDLGALINYPIKLSKLILTPAYVAINSKDRSLYDKDNNGYVDYLDIGLSLNEMSGDRWPLYFLRMVENNNKKASGDLLKIYDYNYSPITLPAGRKAPPFTRDDYIADRESSFDSMQQASKLMVLRTSSTSRGEIITLYFNELPDTNVSYRYSLDNSFWSLPFRKNEFLIKGLTVGFHKLSIIAIDEKGNVVGRINDYMFKYDPLLSRKEKKSINRTDNRGFGCCEANKGKGGFDLLFWFVLVLGIRFLFVGKKGGFNV